MSLSLKTKYMSRLKQNQIIDAAIQSVVSITQNQCSLSEMDLKILNEALEKLRFLRRKKGKTNEQIRNEIASIAELLLTFFTQE